MKCPKCGYLGFETTERCRHCGYDFSLSVPVDRPSELPLRANDEPEAPLADFDLDRMIGEPEPQRLPSAVALATPPPEDIQRYRSVLEAQPEPEPEPAVGEEPSSALPLFTGSQPDADDMPLVAPPPPARPPLAVRRATPEVARRRTPRTIRRDLDGLELQLEPAMAGATGEPTAAQNTVEAVVTAGAFRRISAAMIDVALLGAINGVILYLTLAITGLTLIDLLIIPPIPMIAFLLLLDGGYLIAFTAASGQTIGKMAAGVRVIGDDGGRVDVAGAVLRASGMLLSIVLLGVPYLLVLVSSDGRALHDRLAGTRVVYHA